MKRRTGSASGAKIPLYLAGALVIFVCTLISCASTSFAAAEPHNVPEDFFGISPDRSPLNREDFDLLDEFGAVWIRTTARWSRIEKQEGVWDFEYWDTYVDKAKAAGKKVILILAFDNPWLYSDNREHRNLAEREIPYFCNYVEQMVNRYRGRVDAFEIWNEPNWFFWKGTNEHFYALSAAAAKRAKEVDPDAVILAGSTFRVHRGFLRGMFKAGGFENTDGISVHPYASDALHTVKQVDKLRKIMREFNYDKPIWVTEVGYATGGIYFSSNKLKRYPEYIVKTLSGLSVRGVRNAIWYELMDEYNRGETPNRWNPSQFFGLVYPDKTFKPGAKAFMLTSLNLAGAEYRPEYPLREGVGRKITSLYYVKQGGESVLVLWKDGLGKETLRLIVTGTDDVMRHDIHTGGLMPLSDESSLEITRDPVFITWKGGGIPRIVKE